MSGHTSEPWIVGDDDKNEQPTIYGDEGRQFVGLCAHECLVSRIPEAAANAKRIVACVNACAGINPEAVPELLEAAINAVDWLCDATPGSDQQERGQALRTAIANAEQK